MATGFDSLVRSGVDSSYFAALVEATQGVRRMGSAATELALVAAGRFDVYFERRLDVWDTTAGALVVEEAGGEVTRVEAVDDVTGEVVVASTPTLHEKVSPFVSRSRVLD